MLKHAELIINLKAIGNNLWLIRKTTGDSVKILLPVKADAYGHGITQVSRYVEKHALADMLGVATLDEGIELRNAGIALPILVLGLIIPDNEHIAAIIRYSLSQTVADIESAELISEQASSSGKNVNIHLKVDTGMGRIGCEPEKAGLIAKKISEMKNIELEGIFSHLPSADNNKDFTEKQILSFKNIVKEIEKTGISFRFRHIANSAGILNFPDKFFNMVRPGILSYGYPPVEMEGSSGFESAMTFKSYIVYTKRVAKGTRISYGLTYELKNDSNIATVSAGYGDGYNRLLSNRGIVIINGKRYNVAGRVCMDQIMIDLGNDTYPVGTEVTLFGEDGITAATIAGWIGTIPYEVTCSISKRVQRIYKE